MNISLTPEFEALVNEKVESGQYHSASEVVREALRLLRDHDTFQRIRQEELRREIAVGVEAAKQGKATTYDDQSLKELFDNIKAEGRARLAAQHQVAET